MSERGSENGVGCRFPAERAAKPRRHGLVRAACAAASAATVPPHLADLDARGLKRPEFVIVAPEARVPRDGAPGLEAALVALWGNELPIQRCTIHKHHNLIGHAPSHMHDELTEDYRDMIYASPMSLEPLALHWRPAAEVEKKRKAFLRKWRLKCKAVADSLVGEGGPWPRWGRVSPLNGDRLFTFTRLDPAQWKAARTTNAIERLNEEFRRRIKTQTVLPCV